MSKKNAAGTVSFIFVAIMLSKVLGQLREMVIAAVYGTSAEAGAYVIASQIPVNFFDMILGSAVSSAFIPIYNRFVEHENAKRANLFASRFLNLVILITLLLSAIGMCFAPFIISLFAPEMAPSVQMIAAKLLRIMFPMVIFTGMAFTLVGLLQSLGEFKIPAIMSLISNAVCIIYLLTLNNVGGIYGLGTALLVGWVLQFSILVYPAYKRGFRYSLKAGVRDSGLTDVAKLALPVLFASWVQPINTTVNMAIASGMNGGSGVPALNYANRLYIIAASVFAVSLTNYIFPKLSKAWVNEDGGKWSKTLIQSIRLVLIIVLPIALVFLLQGEDIIRIIYKRGEFTEADVALTSSAMFFYSLGMMWYSLQEIFNKAFYSSLDSKTPMVIAMGGIVTNIVFCFILSKYMGIAGLAFSASVSALLWSVVSFVKIKPKLGGIKLSAFQLPKIAVMGLAMGLVIYFVRKAAISAIGTEGFIYSVITFVLPAAAGCLVYLVLAVLLKLDEMKVITDKFRRFKGDV